MNKEHFNNINQESSQANKEKVSLDKKRFAETKIKFLQEVENASEITSKLLKEQGVSFGNMMLGVLKF